MGTAHDARDAEQWGLGEGDSDTGEVVITIPRPAAADPRSR